MAKLECAKGCLFKLSCGTMISLGRREGSPICSNTSNDILEKLGNKFDSENVELLSNTQWARYFIGKKLIAEIANGSVVYYDESK